MITVSYDAILGILNQPFDDCPGFGYICSFIITREAGPDETSMVCILPVCSKRFDVRKWRIDIFKAGDRVYVYTSDEQRFGAHKEHDITRKICTVLNNWFGSLECGCKVTHVRGYDIFNTKEDTMTNMTKAELEQKYWEAQRKIDEYERERDRFLKDIDERDQSISDLIDTNEKLTKENDKLSVDISREKDKHDAATEKCKELAKDVEFWKGKAYEMDKKNCELRSRNRELEKELDEEKRKLICKVEITPETCQAIDILQKKVEKLESDNESYELENNDLICSLAHKTRQIEKLEEKNTELENALEAAELKARKNWINSRFGRMGYFDTDMIDNKKNPKEFREILVRECFGRPYYEILYKEDGQMHVGYSSYKLDKVSEWLKEFFID